MAGAVGQRVVLAVAIAVSVMVIGGWTGRTGGHRAEVTVLRGTVNTVNITGTAIGFRGKRVGGPRLRMVDVDGGWVIAGASWFDGLAWHNHGTPTCLRAACRSRSNSAWSKPQRTTTLPAEQWWSG